MEGISHVTVYREQGRFGGWPANGGIWSWGNEILVGFRRGYFELSGGFHAVNRSRPSTWVQGRSLDGGVNWVLEDPGFAEPQATSYQMNSTGLNSPMDFSHPNFAIRLGHSGLRAGAKSWFHYSYDRGRTWQGPYGFPTLGLPGIAARTDFLPLGDGGHLFFLTAAKTNGDEGHAFCARTWDGGCTFEFVSWIGPEPAGWTIMPASVRLADNRILVALRSRDGNRDSKAAHHWIDLYVSNNDGLTWGHAGVPVSETGLGGNPPTLTRLQDGRLCITYGYRRTPFGMRAVISADQGRTWSDEIILRDDGGNHDIGYPRTVERPDGTLVTVYYYDDSPESERYIAATLWKPKLG